MVDPTRREDGRSEAASSESQRPASGVRTGPIARATPPVDVGPLPRFFGRYQLFDHIGRGGMADIFLARTETDLGATRLVVLKQILETLSSKESFSRLFVEEAKLSARLRHAKIVQVLDLGREQNQLYMAMEYVEGFDLHQLLRRLSGAQLALPAEFALFIIREVLEALDIAHRASDENGEPLGIVHRDVSPSNVLVSFEGEVKICDFGIARALSRHAPSPQNAGTDSESKVAGKAAYMSPEQALGEDLDARADIFSVGILLYELCAGRRLYKGTEVQMLELARSASIPPLPDRGLPNHGDLMAIVSKALAKNRSDRFQSAAEMLARLDDYALGSRLYASQIRFGQFLTEHFAGDFITARRRREQAASALAPSTPERDSGVPNRTGNTLRLSSVSGDGERISGNEMPARAGADDSGLVRREYPHAKSTLEARNARKSAHIATVLAVVGVVICLLAAVYHAVSGNR